MFLKLVEFGLIVLAFLFLVTQVFIPVASARPLFPMFGRRAKIEKELAYLEEDEYVQQLEKNRRLKFDDLYPPVEVPVVVPPLEVSNTQVVEQK